MPAPRLLDTVRERLRFKHYSLQTEQAYTGWIRRFILANGKHHPRERGAHEVARFLSDLAVRRAVTASTQNQALSALLFLYREVLGIDPRGWRTWCVRSGHGGCPWCCRRRRHAGYWPQCGWPWLLANLLYGTGMRLVECLRLRVKDVDFARNEITVRDGEGGKDRHTMLPRSLVEPLRREIERARSLHQQDLAAGFGATRLRHALGRKYPRAAREFGWQFVFPSIRRSIGPLDGAERRHRFDDAILARAIKTARGRAGIEKPISAHTLPHYVARPTM